MKRDPGADRKRADPAPSKWSWRMERLWLTPMFRRAVRWGLPGAAVIGLGIWYLSDGARVTVIADRWRATVQAVEDRPEFTVSTLRIEGASDQLQADIQEALPIDLPLSQFRLDIDALRDLLMDLDPVLHAEVRVKSGGVLLLKITERQPAIAWQYDGGIEVLDATGHRVATLADLATAGALPLIAGDGADREVPEALALIEAAAPITDRLVGLTRIGNRRWDVVLTHDQRILLPEAAPAAALDRALAMEEAKDILGRDITMVDLRLPDRPALRLSGTARAELRRLQEQERQTLTESTQ